MNFEWELFSHTDSLASRGAADGYDAVNVGGNFVADDVFRIIRRLWLKPDVDHLIGREQRKARPDAA